MYFFGKNNCEWIIILIIILICCCGKGFGCEGNCGCGHDGPGPC